MTGLVNGSPGALEGGFAGAATTGAVAAGACAVAGAEGGAFVGAFAGGVGAAPGAGVGAATAATACGVAGAVRGGIVGAAAGGAPGFVEGYPAGQAKGQALGAAAGRRLDQAFCPAPTGKKAEAPPPNVMESRELRRPDLNETTKEQIEAASRKNSKGQFIDSKGNVIKSPTYGHKRGLENRRILAAAKQKGFTQEQLNKFVNEHPEYFKIQEAGPNYAHEDEMPGVDNLDRILKDMDRFLAKYAKK